MKLFEANISDIDPGQRFRQDMGDLEGLVLDIKKNGIIQPIAVAINSNWMIKVSPDGAADENITPHYILLAGERRLKASILAELKTIPVRLYDKQMTDLELRSIELAENFYRKDFDYREKTALVAEIHFLETEIHGTKFSTLPDAEGHSMQDTANMLGVSKGSVSQDIKLHKFMEDFGEVDWKSMKNQNEATKMMNRIEEKLIRTELAKRAEEVMGTEDTLKASMTNAYIIADFFEGVRQVPDGWADLVEIDPPYAVNLKSIKKQAEPNSSTTGLGEYNEIDIDDYELFMRRVFKECYRAMKPNSWLVCWFGPHPWFEPMYQWLTHAGFYTNRLVGLWVKGEAAKDDNSFVYSANGQTNSPSTVLANSYEMFYYARKDSPVLSRPGSSNMYGYKPVPPGQKTHPTERPIEMIQDVITTFTAPGSHVLVPFAGSGNTLIAAGMERMIPIGFDLTATYKDGYILKVQEIF